MVGDRVRGRRPEALTEAIALVADGRDEPGRRLTLHPARSRRSLRSVGLTSRAPRGRWSASP